MKNPCGRMVDREHAYQVWQSHDGSWTWFVLKKYQADDDKPYARWLCDVVTPIVPNGEMGDTYAHDIKAQARCIFDRVMMGGTLSDTLWPQLLPDLVEKKEGAPGL